MVEFAQFEGGELGLCRSAATEDVDFGGLVGLEALVDVGGDLGGEQFVAGLGQHAGDVERDVADAEDGDLLGVEWPGAGNVGVTVGGDDALDAGVVGGNAVADETEGRRHAFEEVDAHVCVGLHEGVGGIDAGWSGADDGNAERTSLVSHVQRTTFVDGKCGHPSIN